MDEQVVVGLTGGDHREHLLVGVGAELDHDRTVVDRVRLLDRRFDLFGRLDAHADVAVFVAEGFVVTSGGLQLRVR